MEDYYTYAVGRKVFGTQIIDIESLPLFHFLPGSKVMVFSEKKPAKRKKSIKYDAIAFPYIREIEQQIPDFLANFENKQKILIMNEMPSQYFFERFNKVIDAIVLVLPFRENNFSKLRYLKKFHVEIVVNDYLLPEHKGFLESYFSDIRKNIGDVPIHTDINLDFSFVYKKSGNINTYCPRCKKLLIGRSDYLLLVKKIKNKRCACGNEIYGKF